jgi:RNA polymerase sigma factor (sigma-70 family)
MSAQDFQTEVISLSKPLKYFALNLTSNDEDAKDLLQETLFKAISNRHRFIEKTNLKAWCYTIMKNIFINNYRRTVKANTIVDNTKDLYFLNIPQQSNSFAPESKYSEREILKKVNSLEDEYKVPFTMYFDGYKYKEIADYLGNLDMILDGGECQVGVESTIIDCTGELPKILRPGAITSEMILHSTGLEPLDLDSIQVLRVSGNLEKHYSPQAKVILDQVPSIGQGYIALNSFETPAGVIRLASPRNHEEFARSLYGALRKADELALTSLVVQQPEGVGIAIAIRDRLTRAERGR